MFLSNRLTFFCLFLLTLLSPLLNNPIPTAAQAAHPHFVEPGDSWTALAWRYGTTTVALQALNPHLNQDRQPTIGDTILRPVTGVERNGLLIRARSEPIILLALQTNQTPWAMTIRNGLHHPYTPALNQPLFIETADSPPRDLPPYFATLELSTIPAYPGEGLALRATLLANLPDADLTLGSATGSLLTNNDRAIGLIGTGAFFKPGAPELTIQTDGYLWAQPWRIATDKQWTYNQITLSGTAAAINQEDIAAERTRLFGLWEKTTPVPQWSTPFQEPVTNYLHHSSFYGARRSYNGGPYHTYHEGLDFAAYGGTEVYAPAAGTIVVAEELYVRGGAVIIDHGLGIYSGMYHLSEVNTTVGEQVITGQLVGKVGTTGLSTGNHLHWDLLVNGIWIDPMAWRVNNMGCWILEGWGTPCKEAD